MPHLTITDQVAGMENARSDNDERKPHVQDLTMTEQLLEAFSRQLTIVLLYNNHD